MAYIIKKRNKYLEGHGYSTNNGYNFHWTFDENRAKRFADDDCSVDFFANITKGKILEVKSTNKELKDMYKRCNA